VAGAATAAPAPQGEIRAFKPVADVHVSSARPDENLGRALTLRVNGAPKKNAFLRFHLTGRKAEIESVTLLLHPSASARGMFAVRRVYTDAWRERRVTFANAPRASQQYAMAGPVRRGVWSAIDVTSFVENGDRDVSLAITTRAPRELLFGSRESAQGPRLVVRYAEEDDKKAVVRDLLRKG
jgi:hypothetical protein